MFIMHILKSATFKRWLIIGIAACIFVPILVAGAIYSTPELSKANFIITQNQCFLTFFRWIFVIIFYLAWPSLVKYQAGRYAWTKEKAGYWLQQRIKIVVWLVVFEIFICENILWEFIHWIGA